MATRKQSRSERRNLAELKSFPEQPRFFNDLSDYELEQLADDIDRHGLREKMEILPANKAGFPEGTILSGHQRRRALELIGETSTVVMVRYDLAAADRSEITRLFIEANLIRRQLSALEKAKAAYALYLIEKKRPQHEIADTEESEARDRVGKQIGMSGRHVDRYLKLIKCPDQVQNAFGANLISLATAGKVADLPAKTQKQIAKRIRAGEGAKFVIMDYLPSSSRNGSSHAAASDIELTLSDLVANLKQLNKLDAEVLCQHSRLVGKVVWYAEGLYEKLDP